MQNASSLVKQPNSRHCFVCGVDNPKGLKLSFYDVRPGVVQAQTRVPKEYEGYPGIVHGGIIAAMLDEMVGRAAMYADHEHFRLTAKLEIRYRKPVPSGQTITLVGTLNRERGKFARAHAELFLPDGTLAAEAEGLLADLQPEPLDDADMAALGWRVYPD